MASPTPITEEIRAELASAYLETIEGYPEEERPNVTMDIVNSLATEYGMAPNGVRVILQRAGVYITKKPAAKAAAGAGGATGGRVDKASAHKALSAAIEAIGGEPDMEIIEKLTGKAADYLARVISHGNFAS